jgi:hypothetical protein
MALLRLLTAGKSLVGLKDPEARYRMTDPRSMPKFGSKKNPFSRNAKSASVERPTMPIAQVQVEVPQQQAGLGETQRGDKTSGLVTSGSLRRSNTLRPTEARSAVKPEAKVKVAEGQAARAGSQLSAWVRKLKPLLNFRALKKSKPERPEPRPVQGELSLDKVKVMRNDLSDADFVVVRKRAQTASEPGLGFAEKAEGQVSTPVQSELVNS